MTRTLAAGLIVAVASAVSFAAGRATQSPTVRCIVRNWTRRSPTF